MVGSRTVAEVSRCNNCKSSGGHQPFSRATELHALIECRNAGESSLHRLYRVQGMTLRCQLYDMAQKGHGADE